MARIYGNRDLEWCGDALCRIGSRTPIVTVVPDEQYPQMWRVRRSDGSLTDMVNKTRARDAARGLAMSILNRNKQTRTAVGTRESEAVVADHLDGAQLH
jgi:hypothetical protein